MPDAEAVAVVRATMEALDRGGPDELIDRYDELFTDDFEWRPVLLSSVEGEQTFVGKEQLASYWRRFTEALGPPGVDEPSYEEIGQERVLVTGRLQAKGAGSGVPIDREAVFLFTVVNGRISAGRSFLTRHEAEEFLAHA